MQDEFKLLQRAKQLDEAALAEIHERYYTPLYRYISFRVHDLQTAEDLTSELFYRFLRAIREKSAPQNTLRGWLYAVASNILKEHYRKNACIDFHDLDESISDQTEQLDQQLQQKITVENLQENMTNLTKDQQNVLALRFGFEMPIREVAIQMNKSEGSVKMLQVRAIATLSRILNQGSHSA